MTDLRRSEGRCRPNSERSEPVRSASDRIDENRREGGLTCNVIQGTLSHGAAIDGRKVSIYLLYVGLEDVRGVPEYYLFPRVSLLHEIELPNGVPPPWEPLTLLLLGGVRLLLETFSRGRCHGLLGGLYGPKATASPRQSRPHLKGRHADRRQKQQRQEQRVLAREAVDTHDDDDETAEHHFNNSSALALVLTPR